MNNDDDKLRKFLDAEAKRVAQQVIDESFGKPLWEFYGGSRVGKTICGHHVGECFETMKQPQKFTGKFVREK